jgi:hypothetical protein
VCGGWHGIEPSKPEHHFILRDDGAELTLCNICWLEQVLSDQGDLKKRLRIIDQRDLIVSASEPTAPKVDKFCTACNARLALLEIIGRRLSETELERWRQ